MGASLIATPALYTITLLLEKFTSRKFSWASTNAFLASAQRFRYVGFGFVARLSGRMLSFTEAIEDSIALDPKDWNKTLHTKKVPAKSTKEIPARKNMRGMLLFWFCASCSIRGGPKGIRTPDFRDENPAS